MVCIELIIPQLEEKSKKENSDMKDIHYCYIGPSDSRKKGWFKPNTDGEMSPGRFMERPLADMDKEIYGEVE